MSFVKDFLLKGASLEIKTDGAPHGRHLAAGTLSRSYMSMPGFYMSKHVNAGLLQCRAFTEGLPDLHSSTGIARGLLAKAGKNGIINFIYE